MWITTSHDLGGLIREYESAAWLSPAKCQRRWMKDEYFIDAPAEEEIGPKTLYAVKEMMPCFG